MTLSWVGDILSNDNEEMVVTPWKVVGRLDYNRLINEFGTQPLTEDLLKRIAKKAGYLHPLLKRNHFFCVFLFLL